MECCRTRLICFRYDGESGEPDEYIFHMLRELAPFCGVLYFQSARHLSSSAVARLAEMPGLRSVASGEMGISDFRGFDEVLLIDSRWYGPIFPLEEMFQKMAEKPGDFWGMLRGTDGFGVSEGFLVLRKTILADRRLPVFPVRGKGMSGLAARLEKAGCRGAALIDDIDRRENWSISYRAELTVHAAHFLIDRYRLPFLRTEAFAVDRKHPVSHGAAIFRAIAAGGSSYPTALIERHIRRCAPLSWGKNLPSALLIFM